jgi:AraC-like DNA-binding protein
MIPKYKITDVALDPHFHFHIHSTTLKDASFPMHRHDFFELVIILGGTAVHTLNEKTELIRAGDVFVLKDEEAHRFEEAGTLFHCNIMFDSKMIEPFRASLRQLEGYQALFVFGPLYRQRHGTQSKLHLSSKKLIVASELIQTLNDEYHTKQPGYESLITGYLLQLIVFLSRAYTKTGFSESAIAGHLAKTLAKMETEYMNPLTLSELSAYAGMSTNHFMRSFKNIFEVSPIVYLIQIRIQRACELMRHTLKSITDIAFETGFEDSNYFSRAFKKRMGISPREFRNKTDLSR